MKKPGRRPTGVRYVYTCVGLTDELIRRMDGHIQKFKRGMSRSAFIREVVGEYIEDRR